MEEKSVVPTGIRLFLYNQVLSGTKLITTLQKFRHPILDLYFRIWTFLGDKAFYIAIVPCFFWLPDSDPKLGRLFTLLLTITIYVGNFVKEVFRLPRPPSPPVWRSKEEHDFGLPSIHTMVSFCMTSYLLLYLDFKGLYPLNLKSIAIGLFWVSQVGLSRMYLGVHSPLDLMGGLTIGTVLCAIWLNYGDLLDDILTSHANIELLAFGLFVVLVTLHPRSLTTPSYSRAVVMIGLAEGVLLGSHVHYTQHGINRWIGEFLWKLLKEPLLSLKGSTIWSTTSPQLWRISLRLAIGFLVLNVTFLIWFRIVLIVLKIAFRLPGISHSLTAVNKIVQVLTFPSFPPVQAAVVKPQRKNMRTLAADPITWSKFSASILIAIVVTETVPALFAILDEQYFVKKPV